MSERKKGKQKSSKRTGKYHVNSSYEDAWGDLSASQPTTNSERYSHVYEHLNVTKETESPKISPDETPYDSLDFQIETKSGKHSKKLITIITIVVLVVLAVAALVGALIGVYAIGGDTSSVAEQQGKAGTTPAAGQTTSNDWQTSREGTLEPSLSTTTSLPDAVDGKWSRWDSWSTCTKTCGSGVQVRQRTCSNPPSQNGGLECAGPTTESRTCAEWLCPDCTKTCPAGGTLVDCAFCSCADYSVHGKVTDASGLPLSNVDVYPSEREWEAISKTDKLGKFTIQEFCGDGVEFVFKHKDYNTNQSVATGQNHTHAYVQVSLVRKKSPEFTLHPEDKARIVGQSVTLCCNATGNPAPFQYLWLKDDRMLPESRQPNSSSITIDNVIAADEGTYKCQAISSSGKSLSKGGYLSVRDDADMCSNQLKTRLYDLPEGCAHENSSSVVDVGACEPQTCLQATSGVHAGACADDESTSYCCKPNATETIPVTCTDGTTYELYRIISCACADCYKENVAAFVRGKIYGMTGTQVIPLRFGLISFKGEQISSTDIDGKFSFRVPDSADKLSVKIEDLYFKDLSTSVKVLQYQPGRIVSQSVRIPVRPEPAIFNSSENQEVAVNGSGSDPVGSLVIGSNSMIDQDGNPYEGDAKLFMSFQDLRDVDALATTPGEFVTLDDEGESDELRTFGTFSISAEDTSGNPLYFANPLEIRLDPEKVNVTLGDDGQPDVTLWTLDEDTGSWVEISSLRFAEGSSESFTSRKLLQRSFIVGNLPPSDSLESYYNLDQVATEQNALQCDVKIRAYADSSMRESLPGVTAYILTKSTLTSSWIGYESRVTSGPYGTAYLRTFCPNAEGYIFLENQAENGQSQRLLANISDSDSGNLKIIKSTDVDYTSPAALPTGPFRRAGSASSPHSPHIKFYPPPKLCKETLKNDIFAEYWGKAFPEEKPHACFIRINVTGRHSETFNFNAIAESGAFTESEHVPLGTSQCSSNTPRSGHVMCLEMRCPGGLSQSMPEAHTRVTINLSAKNTHSITCYHNWTNPNLAIVMHRRGNNSITFDGRSGYGFGEITGIVKETSEDGYETARADANEICINKADNAFTFNCY